MYDFLLCILCCRFLGGLYLKSIILGDIRKLEMSNGKTIEQNLLEQANLLRELIRKHLVDYRRSFSPSEYVRSGDLENSIVTDSTVQIVGNQLKVFVHFDENANHRSGFGVWSVSDGRGKYDDDDTNYESGSNVNTALLLDRGYKVRKPVWFKDIENFGHREGAKFVEKAINEFNKVNSMGITLSNSDIIIK